MNDVRLSVDIGGTFTDVVLAHDGKLTGTKVLTTYDDPARGVVEGTVALLNETACDAGDVRVVMHGTTLATNALIERRGARTAMLTTEGHRDVLEMALENRFEQYDVNIRRPEPLVPRHLRLPVSERMNAHGEVLKTLDLAHVDQAIDVLVDQEVESVAVCFLHAYANDAHERQVEARLRDRLPDVSVTLASEVCPEVREYERFSTATANAYVRPLMDSYLSSLQSQFRALRIDAPILLMTSGGGLTTLDTARRYPIRLVESGPAGGALLAAQLARRSQWRDVLSFDMGGTTAKICLIDDGQPQVSRAFEVDRVYRFKKGSGLPVRVPVVEMVEIGAGGGSIAHVDRLKRIAVGPESAGSEPGPAAYGLGGTEPTVTDADLVLGKLSAAHFAGGEMPLHIERSQQAVQRHVAEPLSVDLPTAAFGVSETVDENMASAARAHASEWGQALPGRTLIAFGGAAPLHAASLARKLHMKRVVIPQHAGVGSAVGFLLAPISFEVVRSSHATLSALDGKLLETLFADMRREAEAVVMQAADGAELVEVRRAYMRYVGQGFEIAVDAPALDDAFTAQLRASFEARYTALYGRTIPGQEIEVLSWTLAVSAPSGNLPPEAMASRDTDEVPVTGIQLYDGGQYRNAAVIRREALAPGESRNGPLLVVESQTTTVVPADFSVSTDDYGQLVLALTGENT